MSLFGGTPDLATASTRQAAPLAERMRPRTLDEYMGQQHLVAPGKPLRMQIESDDPASMIFWGPPGVGKTTLAKIIAETTHATFIEFSAVLSGIKEIKQVMVDAEKAAHYGSRTILFVDEIHRFNKAQQDAFLPYVERGTIRLIGATTENPSFEIIAALLSRCRVYTLQPLSEDELLTLLRRALADERGLAKDHLVADEDALALIASYASGDARGAYNALEIAGRLAATKPDRRITREIATEALQKRVLLYDKSGEQHYDLISALHKSIRNSDVDASLYWLGRMLAAGEDPALRRTPAGPHGVRRYRSRRARGAEPDAFRARCYGFSRLSRRRAGTCAGRRIPCTRAQVERGLHRLGRGAARTSKTPAPSPSRCTCATRPPG